LVDGETTCAKTLAKGVPAAGRFKSLILLFFFSGAAAGAGRSVPGGQFLPEAFTGG
jgi:hypothetical protein